MNTFSKAHPARKSTSASVPREIAILKTGRYTDANGRTYDITPAVLEDIARNTPSNSAPLVKGHPSSEAPSMGWVQGLKVAGDKLLAVFGKIDPAFAEEVKAEAFRNVSASFFQPYAPSNPRQGHYVLRHVGALGAARPAIPGLGTLQEAFGAMEGEAQKAPWMAFSFCIPQDGEGIVAFSENTPIEGKTNFLRTLKGLFNSLNRDELKEQIRKELLIELSEQQTKKEASMPDESRIAELEKQLEASNTALAKEKAERERLTKEAETVQSKAAVSAEVDKLGETKQISPEQKTGLIDKALALVGAGQKPQEAVAAFAEYLPDRVAASPARRNWGARQEGKGLANFSEQDDPAFGEDFALKKAAYEKQGLSPDAAYDTALRETQKK